MHRKSSGKELGAKDFSRARVNRLSASAVPSQTVQQAIEWQVPFGVGEAGAAQSLMEGAAFCLRLLVPAHHLRTRGPRSSNIPNTNSLMSLIVVRANIHPTSCLPSTAHDGCFNKMSPLQALLHLAPTATAMSRRTYHLSSRRPSHGSCRAAPTPSKHGAQPRRQTAERQRR